MSSSVETGAARDWAWARRPWVGALAGGGLTAVGMIVAFPRHEIPEAAYVALVPFLLWNLFVRPAWRWVAGVSFAVGLLQWAVLLWWLRHFPEQVGLSPAWGYLGWLLLSAVLALFWVAWGLIAAWGIRRLAQEALGWRLLLMLGLAGAWVVLEWVRSWIFSGFPWLPLAASQWDRQLLLQLLPWTGAWGLSFVLVLFNAGLAFYVRHLLRAKREVWYKRFSIEFYLGLAGIFVAVASGVGELQKAPDRPMFRAAFVQPYVKPPERWDKDGVDQLLELYATWMLQPTALARGARAEGVERWAQYAPDLILWPEASTPLPAPGSPRGEAWLNGIVAEGGVPLVMGNLAVQPGPDGEAQWFNAVVFVDPVDGVSPEFVAKRKLVPFGEAMPAWLPFLDKLIPTEASFTPGSGASNLAVSANGREWNFAPLVCYEDLFPAVARRAALEGTDLFFVATNDAWYGEESAAYQHMVHSVLRAVETRRPVLRAGNAGWSGWIDERGYVRFVVERSDTGSVYVQKCSDCEIARSADFAGRTTLYVRWGDWFVVLSGVCVLFLGGAGWGRPDR